MVWRDFGNTNEREPGWFDGSLDGFRAHPEFGFRATWLAEDRCFLPGPLVPIHDGKSSAWQKNFRNGAAQPRLVWNAMKDIG